MESDGFFNVSQKGSGSWIGTLEVLVSMRATFVWDEFFSYSTALQ